MSLRRWRPAAKATARFLQQAIIAHVEEAIRLHRHLGLQADIAMSLGTANICYQATADTEAPAEARTRLLQRALSYIEEAVTIFRELGVVHYLALALRYAIITHLQLGELTTPDLARIEVLCEEGETLCNQMGVRRQADQWKITLVPKADSALRRKV